jgi:hypothetical protein
LAKTGSEAPELTLTVLLTEPVAEGATVTATVKTAVTPEGMLAIEHDTVPVAPTAGVVQLQPPGAVSELKVMTGGKTSLSVTLGAASGPLLVMTIV